MQKKRTAGLAVATSLLAASPAHAFTEREAQQAVRATTITLARAMDARLHVGDCRVRGSRAVCPEVRIIGPRDRCRLRVIVSDQPDFLIVRFGRVACR